MSARDLALVLLRCSGVIAVVTGCFHVFSYIPLIFRHAERGGLEAFGTNVSFGVGGIFAGVILILFSGPLSSAIARGAK